GAMPLRRRRLGSPRAWDPSSCGGAARRAPTSRARRRRRGRAAFQWPWHVLSKHGHPAVKGIPRAATNRHSPRNFVGTRVVDSTSCFEALTYFTIVGMCPLVSFNFPCISALVGSISFLMTDFHCA